MFKKKKKRCPRTPPLVLARSLAHWSFRLPLCYHLVLQSGLTRFPRLTLLSVTVISTAEEKYNYFLEAHISALNLVTNLASFWILEITALNLCMDFGKNEIFITLIVSILKYVLTFYITVTF